jgi:hypothetical protein
VSFLGGFSRSLTRWLLNVRDRHGRRSFRSPNYTTPGDSPAPGRKDPYAGGRLDVSGQQELDPAGGHVSSGSAPSGTGRVALSSSEGTPLSVAADTGDPWSGRAFFIAVWPAPKPARHHGLYRTRHGTDERAAALRATQE